MDTLRLADYSDDALRRFWAKVDAEGDCWEWVGARARNGYGRFGVSAGAFAAAHRFSYQALIGEIPEGLELDHLCRNRACVNPDHLEPVTRQENRRRGIRKALDERQTHCRHGHEFTPENTLYDARGCRCCRACGRRRTAQSRARKAA